jgi:hypothetical protein
MTALAVMKEAFSGVIGWWTIAECLASATLLTIFGFISSMTLLLLVSLWLSNHWSFKENLLIRKIT